MEERNYNAGGPANTPPFDTEPRAVRSAADHQIPEETGAEINVAGGASRTETERELERTRDVVAEAAAPVMAEKTQEAITEAADRLSHDPQVQDQLRRTASAVQHDAQRMAREKVGEVGSRVEERVNQGMRQAADRIENVAQQIDRVAEERMGGSGMRGRAGQMAHTVADTMESVAGYLRSNDAESLRQELEQQMRRKPLQTLMIGVAAGWVVGKILR